MQTKENKTLIIVNAQSYNTMEDASNYLKINNWTIQKIETINLKNGNEVKLIHVNPSVK